MSLAAFVVAATLFMGASAQTPFYQGALYLQPGNNSNKCMQAANFNGAPVVLADCATGGSEDQQWIFSGGSVKIYGNKCLDVTDGNNVDGVKLQVWDCWPNSVNQQFYYTRDYRLAWTNHGKCTDLTDGSMANGNRIQLWGCSNNNPNQRWDTGYMFPAQPDQSQVGQTGTNNCRGGTGASPDSNCQTLVLNSLEDFCLWGPPTVQTIGDSEAYEVAWCLMGGHGTRIMPSGTITGAHFVKTPDYVQITGQGDFTKINVKAQDEGGELDNHGADGNGNPVGGLVYGMPFSSSGVPSQFHEWTNFMSATEFCIRACTGPNAAINCNHIYDVMGCAWNMPASYSTGVFESCNGDDSLPMGIYTTAGTVSTWYQGVNPTPSAHPVPSSSQCTTTTRIGY